MHIFIDEAGTFVYTPETDAWSTACALVVPDGSMAAVEQALLQFKEKNGFVADEEVKLNAVKDEVSYFTLLIALANANCTLFALAVDAHTNTPEATRNHQEANVRLLLKHKDKMRHSSGREAVQLASDQVAQLSAQLYTQFICQVQLMHDVVSHAITYYAQHSPAELSSFTWRVDQKEPTKKTEYEEAFEKLSPAYLQTLSLSNPLLMIEGMDYSHLSRYVFPPGEEPTYLRDDYNIDIDTKGSVNLQRLFREDIRFVDSKDFRGVQLADLLSSGLRRCLRDVFKDNLRAAAFLGRLMVQHQGKQPPLLLLSLGEEKVLEGRARALVNMMHRQQRPFLRRAAK